MIINDLNYLEDAAVEVFGGRGVATATNVTINKTVTANVTETITKTLSTNIGGLQGNVAQAIGSADARGSNVTFTSIIGTVQTEADSSESFLQLVAASK